MNRLSNLEFFKLVAGNGDAGAEESPFGLLDPYASRDDNLRSGGSK